MARPNAEIRRLKAENRKLKGQLARTTFGNKVSANWKELTVGLRVYWQNHDEVWDYGFVISASPDCCAVWQEEEEATDRVRFLNSEDLYVQRDENGD